jgi:V/A-type H+-transporting ATPase subunit I
MSFLPARMSRLLIGGHQNHLEGVIEALHAEGVLHIEDYHDPTHTTSIGTPLEAGDRASQMLVRVRGVQKALGAEGAAPGNHPGDPAEVLAEAEAASHAPLETVAHLRGQLLALDAEEATLGPLSGLELELSAMGALHSVRIYAGTVRSDPAARIQAAGLAHEIQVAPGPAGLAVLLVVGAKDAPAADKILAENGYSAAVLPANRHGTPAQRLAAIAAERTLLLQRLAASESELATLRTRWAPRLAAVEHALVALVEKTQAPLRFGVTQTTFHLEGWVPRSRLAKVKAALAQRFGEQLYTEDLGDAPREHAPEAAKHGGHGAQAEPHAAPHAPDAKDEPPIHLENPRVAKPYEFLLGLLGKPRYGEIDPTKLMLVFFPLFFGLMVGDVLVGAVIVAVGQVLKTRKLFGIGGPAVGRALVAGGILSILVGGVVFGEAMGIHFVVPDEELHSGGMSWESVLGLHLPYADQPHGLLFKTGSATEAAPEGAHGGGLAGMLAPHTDVHLSLGGWFNLGYYSKVHDIQALLLWSTLIGLVHLVLGLAIGVRNVHKAHGATLAIQEKAAWLSLMVSVALLVWGLMAPQRVALAVGGGLFLASVALLWMGAQHVFGAGFIALLEIPGLLGNLLSYTRLAAIGASKAGMVIALNAIGFTIAGGGVVGWAIYIVGFAAIIPLAILAGGLQSLRLQFVEFFQKFYVGGGRPYVPFGRRAA